jgi:hypothetical protein
MERGINSSEQRKIPITMHDFVAEWNFPRDSPSVRGPRRRWTARAPPLHMRTNRHCLVFPSYVRIYVHAYMRGGGSGDGRPATKAYG